LEGTSPFQCFSKVAVLCTKPYWSNCLRDSCGLQGELTRIKDKVSQLLKRKDAARAELTTTLLQLQSQSAALQDTLEDLRASALAN